MRRYWQVIAILAGSLLIWLVPGLPAAAAVGVGIDTGKIELTELLVPGGIYHLPTIGVINTGDETADYQVDVTYISEQAELKPAAAWFSFEPERFRLGKGTSRRIAPTLCIPMDARAGEYLALVEASPVVSMSGTATLGVAAATKLSFSIREANLAVAVIHRSQDFFRDSSPWIYIGLAAIAAGILYLIFRRHFKFSFKVEKKS